MNANSFGQVILVGCGGFVGASARFVVSGLVHRILSGASFPYGTLVVNVTGCLAIGLFGGLLDLRQLLGPSLRLFLLIGVLGGFTTFSTFAYETLNLAHTSEFLKAGGNVLAHVAICLLAAWGGYLWAQQL